MRSLPEFPEFTRLELEHREELEGWFARWPPLTSELTFTNLYLWRGTYQPTLTVIGGMLVVRAQPEQQEAFFLPPVGGGDMGAVCHRLLAWLGERAARPSLQRVPAPMAAALGGAGRPFLAPPTPEHSDYLYRTLDLIYLQGNRYHPKRSHIHKFESEHRWEYRRLTPDLLDQCRQLQERWCEQRGCEEAGPALGGEHQAVMSLLADWERLGARGGVILVGGRVVAFSAGEQLNPTTAVIHVEKAAPDLPGLYQLINREFAREWAQLQYINREQDLGDPGLRKAKQSYYPHHLVDKFMVIAA